MDNISLDTVLGLYRSEMLRQDRPNCNDVQ